MYINVNDVNLYYKIYGNGTPIILVHGNSETHEIFDVLINKLKDNYKVYAIDIRWHGKGERQKKVNKLLLKFIVNIRILMQQKPFI